MGKKRRNKDPGRVRQVHPQQSFQQQVADATLEKFRPYIDQQLQGVAGALAQQQNRQLEGLYIRLLVLENIVEEKLGIDKEDLANRVSEKQDELENLVPVKTVEKGDRVRVEIQTKTKDQEEFQGESRMMIENVGSGQTIGPELETPLIGMSAGDTKEIPFGKEKAMVAKITVNRVSRAPKVEEPEEEVANDSNAG